jgi:endonuclease/exonuclease/phosphatase family metal-dependent hydrolase
MPTYKRINELPSKISKRAIERLLDLRQKLDEIPKRTQKETLLLATWNIREFDSPMYGPRMKESIYYIAEIIARFDLVALQEVHRNLDALEDLMKILGDHWDYVITDTTEGAQGNDERLAFVYDTRKVKHSGLAGELVLPPVPERDDQGKIIKNAEGKIIYKPVFQLWRTPYICGFRAGWCDFMLATVHIQWGESIENPESRIAEIKKVAQFLKNRTEDEKAWARNLILLGDFNIWKPDNDTFKELEKAEFIIPEQIQKLPSNISKKMHYDQIAFRDREKKMELTGKAGVFEFYKSVYRDEDRKIYEEYMPDGYWKKNDGSDRPEEGKYSKKWYYGNWRTYQMSDHLPMWVELRIDYSDSYLKKQLEEID